MEYVTLNNDVWMPILGYGVYQVKPEECERCLSDALEVGYHSIDTAQAYYNEEDVGNAVEKSGVPRSELFLTTKVWISNAGFEKAKASIEESLENLNRACVDLVYAADKAQSADLRERMESRHGTYTLDHAESLGLGSQTYFLENVDV